jgi:thiazole synthase
MTQKLQNAVSSATDTWQVAGQSFTSRLLVGTGKYQSMQQTVQAIEASGAQIITVALRRVNLDAKKGPSLQETLDPKHYTYLPNSAGCTSADEAVKTLMLARELGGWNLVKLEVMAGDHHLYPEPFETLKATKRLVQEGFDVMVYTNDDPITAKKLEDAGAAAIMPLAAPIGSGLGIQNPLNIGYIIAQSSVPVLVDAGVGTASDAAIAMELGCAGVLMNTAIALADDPVRMAGAMKHAIIAGREAFLAGRMRAQQTASASSPLVGKVA